MNTVIVERCEKYDLQKISAKLEFMLEALEKTGPILKEGMKVVIKPNLVSARHPEYAATTHPVIIEALIRLCQKRGCSILVAESPAGKMDEAKMKLVLHRCEIRPVIEACGVDFWMSDQARNICLKQRSMIQIPILTPFLDADLIINCAKLKSHSYTLYTGAVKNCFGMVPGLVKAQFHAQYPTRNAFSRFIGELAYTMAPQLNVLDAVTGMHKEGPTNGEAIEIQRLLISQNPFALDEVAMRMIGLEPTQTPVFAQAIKYGFYNSSSLKIICPHHSWENLKVTGFEVPSKTTGVLKLIPSLDEWFQKIKAPYPKIDSSRCLGCQECFHDCPQSTIVMKAKKAHIIKKNCIRCYCCQEVCPAKAVFL